MIEPTGHELVVPQSVSLQDEMLDAPVNTQDPHRLLRIGHAVKQGLEGAVIAAEALPFIGGPIRYGGFAAILAMTRNEPLAVGYLASSTFALEGAASIAMADVLQRDSNRAVQLANKFANKFVRPDKRVTPLAEAAITNYLGVPLLLAVKQRENPNRTFRENVRHGLFATSLLTGAIALQGAAIAEGVTNITDPKVVATGAGVIGGLVYAGRRAKKKLEKENDSSFEVDA